MTGKKKVDEQVEAVVIVHDYDPVRPTAQRRKTTAHSEAADRVMDTHPVDGVDPDEDDDE